MQVVVRSALLSVVILTIAGLAPAQKGEKEARDDLPETDAIGFHVARGVALLLEMQEGKERGQWPYEGVYRVRREIPIG